MKKGEIIGQYAFNVQSLNSLYLSQNFAYYHLTHVIFNDLMLINISVVQDEEGGTKESASMKLE